MRRGEREVRDKEALRDIIRSCDVCRVAFCTDSAPYIVPLSFGFSWDENLELYFHCALEGRKIDLMRSCDLVGFEMDSGQDLIKHEIACKWSTQYKSVIGAGRLRLIDDHEKKILYLNRIMGHYGYEGPGVYDPAVLRRTAVLRLDVTELSGKEKR
ncbi:MAG: pyridoxamine 5'-phosphate oxidase family protein [Spirochaetia bacterium]|nr:pyridoxamine 5'-phosphate oxidase family protein [Spirochaetia bacterium]MCE1208243.1 pyridoxamine 5'-phosphate oxidase family protein [Spirochaetia bacterium]